MKLPVAILFSCVLVSYTSFAQQQYTFTHDANGRMKVDSTSPGTKNTGKTDAASGAIKKTVIYLWDSSGQRMSEAEAKEAAKLPNVSKKWEVVADTIYMRFTVLSNTEKEDAFKKLFADMEHYRSEHINKPAPAFSVKDIDGNIWSSEQLKGKTVVLNFWFTGCMPCRQEMPALKELATQYESKDVVFISLALDDKEALKTFLKTNYFHYKTVPEAESIGKLFSINAYPTNIVIDKSGIVRELLVGSTDDIKEKLESTIKKVMG